MNSLRTLRLFGLSFLALCCCAGAAFAQADAPVTKLWDKTYGGRENDELQAIVATADGGFLIGGRSDSNADFEKSENIRGSWDYWVIRVDAQGNKLWDKIYGGDNRDELTSIVAAADGGFLLGGWSYSDADFEKSRNSKGESDYWIVRIDAQGNKLWDRTYGGADDDHLLSVVATSDGGFLLGGWSESDARFDKSEDSRGDRDHWDVQIVRDYWVVRVDERGRKLWDKTYGGVDQDELVSIVAADDGGFLLGGWSESDAGFEKSEDARGSSDFWVVRIDAQGNQLWDKTYSGEERDRLHTVLPLADGGFLLGGFSTSDSNFDKSENSRGSSDYWVVRIDAQGNQLWDKTYGGEESDILYTMLPLADGGFLLGGWSESNAGFEKSENRKETRLLDFDYWVVRIDAQGNKLWDKTYGGSNEDRLHEMTNAMDGGYLLGGKSKSSKGFDKSESQRGGRFASFDFWALKIIGLTAGPDTALCDPGAAVLKGASDYEDAIYRWEPAALVQHPDALQTPTLELTETTTFTLTATLPDESAVSDEATITIAEEKPRFRSLLKRNAYGADFGVIRLTGTGGTPPYEYRLNDGAYTTERFFRNLPARLYQAEIRDANGCEGAAEIRLR